jgi:hypothetical protein
MKIAIGLQANCSESTIRLNLEKQPQKKIDELIHKLRVELAIPEYHEKQQDWDDQEDKKEYEWSEGYVYEKTIFGMPVLEISGDAPYNYGEEIEEVIRRYLPKAKMENTE